MHYLNEQNIYIFLIQVFILLGLARGLGELFRRWKQPPLTAEILVGILLGPTFLGRISPFIYQKLFPLDPLQQNMLETVAWFGVLFFLLETGLEIDFSSAWRQRGDALKIALLGIIVPIVTAFAVCYFLPANYLVNQDQRLIFALFMAIVMSISAMPIAARALADLKLSKTDLGFLIVSALSVNDIIGWMLFTMVIGFSAQAGLLAGQIILVFAGAIGFIALCLTGGRHFTNYVISKIKEKQLPQPGASLTFICLLGLLCGAITQKIGIHALFGFFIAGIMAGSAKALSEKTRQVISQMVYAIFVPLFFANIGLKIDFLKNIDLFLIVLISVIGILGKFLGAWLGVSLTKISKVNRLPIAIAHTPGGTMEIIVGMLALEYGLITEPVFVAIVCGAVFSSVILGPWLSRSIRKRKEVGILEYFSKREVIVNLSVSGRDEAIEKLCGLASGQGDMPEAETILAQVLKRENEMGTAIEEGIAFPHARLTALKKTVVVFGRSFPGIDWNSPDGKLANFIFLILTPKEDIETQLQILSIIAREMGKETVRRALIQAGEVQEIWEILQDIFKTKHIIRK